MPTCDRCKGAYTRAIYTDPSNNYKNHICEQCYIMIKKYMRQAEEWREYLATM